MPKTTVAAPPELIAPAAVVVGQVAGEGGIQRASGYIAAEPGTFLAGVKSRGDLTFLDGENEGFEAEATVQSGTNQVFWKVKKVCDEGSTFTAIITTSGG